MLGHVSYWTFAPGAGLIACGEADNLTMQHHHGIGLVAVGVVLAVVNVGATLPRARARDVTWAAIAIAITYLLSTLVLGVVLLHNIHTGFIAGARLRVLATHLHVAIVGWALVMIVGVSHRLLPMFLLAHGADARWTPRALALIAAGVPLFAMGINLQAPAVTWIGVAMLELGLACFVCQAQAFFRARVRKRVDIGMRYAAAGVAFMIAAALLGPVVLWRGVQVMSGRLAIVYVLAGLVAGVILFVCGFFYKIVPLLAWTARFGGRGSGTAAPTVAQLFSARVAAAQLGVMVSGLVLLSAAIMAESARGAYAGAGLFALGVLLFASQIGRVAFGNRARGAT
jgi:hypothetical protein